MNDEQVLGAVEAARATIQKNHPSARAARNHDGRDGRYPRADDLDALTTWQRILAAEREANFLRWLVRQPPRTASKESAA